MALEEKHNLTYEDYRALPDDGKRYMLFDGELFMVVAPRPRHQRLIGELSFAIQTYLKAHPIGELYISPVDVRPIPGVAKAWQPDLVYVANERLGIITEEDIQGAPDLVVEVVSPGSFKDDIGRKKRTYQEAGVKEYWIAWQDVARVEVYRLNDAGRYGKPQILETGDSLTTELLPGFALALNDLYRDLPLDEE